MNRDLTDGSLYAFSSIGTPGFLNITFMLDKAIGSELAGYHIKFLDTFHTEV
jgi:hypothetical protein